MVRIKLVYDNTTFIRDAMSDWGFAAVIETDERKILFDTGADGETLLHNLQVMNINPMTIDTVFMSHHHFDHVGGLASFLAKNNKVTVWVPKSLRGIRNAAEVNHLDASVGIGPNLYSTGELSDIEHALCIKTEKGIVLIVGCSHPGLDELMNAAGKYGEIHAVIGGFHGFTEFDVLKDVDVICPTHCTQYANEIEKLYPEKCIPGGVGQVIEI